MAIAYHPKKETKESLVFREHFLSSYSLQGSGFYPHRLTILLSILSRLLLVLLLLLTANTPVLLLVFSSKEDTRRRKKQKKREIPIHLLSVFSFFTSDLLFFLLLLLLGLTASLLVCQASFLPSLVLSFQVDTLHPAATTTTSAVVVCLFCQLWTSPYANSHVSRGSHTLAF